MEDVRQSANDTRQYRVITLENGLTALLVSDHKTRPLSSMSCSSSRHSSPSRQSTSTPGSSKKASHGCLVGAEDLPDVKIGDEAQVPSLPKVSLASSIANYLSSANCEDVPHSKSPDEGHCDMMAELGSGSSSRPPSLEEPFSDASSDESMSDDDVSVRGWSNSEPESDMESGQYSRENGRQHYHTRKEKMAAAALCVGVGSFHEPEHLPGLAHFLEHMVFMGSSKYPRENFFDAFLKKHGGSDNAYTECERTVYKMEVHQKHFYRALDIFANCFVSPLIRKESMERELEAIDNEFQIVLPSDSSRLQQLLGSVARKKHPMRKFMWGNTKTLKKLPEKNGTDVHAALHTFFEQHYSPAIMNLAVQSRHSLDELECMVREIFSAIPVREPAPELPRTLTNQPFPLERFAKLYKVQPVKKVNNVSFTWALPSLIHEYRTKPLEYISYVVGHEGTGSILAYLRNRMWALGLVAGNEGTGFHHNTICTLFNITVSLTEEGLKHVREVIVAVFSFLAMLRKVGPVKSIFEEIQTVANNSFRWSEEESPLDYVERICANMQLYPPKHYLDGEICLFEYDPALIQKCLDYLVPHKANIMIISSQYQNQGICTKKEPYLETPYCVQEIPREWLAEWSSLVPDSYFEIPERNKYIATDFTLKQEKVHQSELPVKLHEDQRFRLWYKKDTKFNVPKACVFFQLISPVMHVSVENAVLMDILCDTLLQNMSQETNAAVCASLDFTISVNENGLIISVLGFNEKLPVLFDVILHHLAAVEVKQQLFENIKKHVQKRYYNLFMKPSRLCTDTRFSILQQCQWSNIEKRRVIEDVTLSSLLCFVEEFRKRLFVEGLVHGNFTASEAIAFGELVVKKLNCAPLPTCMIPESRVMQIPFGNQYCRLASFNIEDRNSMIVNYYQIGPGSIKQHALAELMIDFMEEPCFDILRTKTQLGYDVSCSYKSTSGIVGFTVGVCSSAEKFTCSYVDEQIELFLFAFSKKIAELTQEEFATQVSSLVKQKSCSDLYMQEESDRYWEEIVSFDYVFDRLQREIDILKALTLEEFKESCKLFLPSKNSGEPHRRKLSIQIVGFGEAAIAESRPIGYPAPQTPTSSTGDIHNASAEGKTLSYEGCIENMHNVPSWKNPKLVTDQNSPEGISCEEMAYSLQFLESVIEKQDAVYVNDIIVFKQGLAVFPVCKVTS